MFAMKAMFALFYISVNVMAIITVFRFEDVSRATLSAFGSVSSLLPVVDALNLQVDNHHRSSAQLRQQQRPDLSLSMRTVADGGLFQVSQGTDIFNDNNNDDGIATSSLSTADEQQLAEDLQQQHEQMKKMMQMIRDLSVFVFFFLFKCLNSGHRLLTAYERTMSVYQVHLHCISHRGYIIT